MTANAGGQAVDLRLLGRPGLRVAGQDAALPSGRALGLIAYLALGGRTPRARLAALLWDEFGQDGARKYLRQTLYRLRSTPLGPHLVMDDLDLALHGSVVSDVARFRALLAERRWREALALYRGELLEGTEIAAADEFHAWLEAEREELATARRGALARWADELEAAGEWRAARDVHLEALRGDELQEAHHRALMRLHALLGEREAALERFERLRRVLRDELGLEPLPETVDLERQIRTAGALDREREVGAHGGALPPAPLVGREGAWAWLSGPRTGLSLVLGEPGVGKTRLTGDFARACGPLVILRGQELAGGTPLAPVAEVLRAALAASTPAGLPGLAPVWRQEAARLVPELEPGTPPAAPTPEGRTRFLEGLAHALLAAAGPGGTVLLDDLHWFDPSTVEVAAQVERHLRASGGRLLATARPAELTHNRAVGVWLAGLDREGHLARLTLEGLEERAVLTLIQRMSGRRAVLFSRRLHGATGGNPLFMLETLRELQAAGLLHVGPEGWSTPYDEETRDYHELPLPPSVREAVLARVDSLGPAVRRLLEAASLTGSAFDPELLWGATALSEWEGLEALEQAASADLVRADAGAYRFAHDLLRRAVEDALSPQRRLLVHRRLAAELAAKGGAPATVAHHLERGGRGPEAAGWRVRAGQAAEAVYAHEDAIEHYEQALRDGLDERSAFPVHLALAELHKRVGHLDRWRDEVERAGEVARRLNDATLLAEVTVQRSAHLAHTGRWAEAVAEAGRVLNMAAPPELRGRAHLNAGSALRVLGRAAEAERHLRAALGLLRGADLANARIKLTLCLLGRGALEEAEAMSTQALADCHAVGYRVGEIMTLHTVTRLAVGRSDLPGARRAAERALDLAREFGLRTQELVSLDFVVWVLQLSGDDAGVERHLLETLDLARSAPDPLRDAYRRANLADVQRRQGKLGEALRHLTEAAEVYRQADAPSSQGIEIAWALGDLRLALGDLEQARGPLEQAAAELETFRAGGELQGELLDLFWHVACSVARLSLAEGRPEAALGHLKRALESGLPVSEGQEALVSTLTGLARGEGRGTGVRLPGAPSVDGARALILRLDEGSGVAECDGEAASALLGSGRLPALEETELRLALARTLDGEERRAHDLRREAGQRWRVMAQTLPVDARDRFLARLTRLEGEGQPGPAPEEWDRSL